ncbi:hypothetical protein [Sulfurimonas sp.]|uniref:hypothetical protein n=1 Tax=Sulfurimonas sp. TaxID=2022749 RepID=UPI0025E4AFA7|nr:hypothetical protein [Sulfurimonas sp.]
MLLDQINTKLEEILKIHKALPTWVPLSKHFAQECGYKTMDGLRKWCMNHFSPDEFQKLGNHWHIHVTVLHKCKRKVV